MDPYQILGVSPNAGDDEIKKAYRDLVKRYHPDRYAAAPQNVQDQASEKAKQINAAYDQIQKMRAGGSSGAGGYGGYRQYGGASGYGSSGGYEGAGGSFGFEEIRQLIAMGQVLRAESLLLAMQDRPARWHYLYGLVNMRKGQFAGARECFETACRMEPGTLEYRQALEQLDGVLQQNRRKFSFGGMGDGFCQLCQCLLCLSACGGGRFCC
ncbi:MAG: DnaJ domain-containing protein [Christensenellaceae bacterium]|jgi:molecular chaperone DnaJ|nr:DnaJ domain-containing protein [Christensenellaceae bacterium]